MKYKLNKQERKEILQKTEEIIQETIIDTNWEDDLNDLILIFHRINNHLTSHEVEKLISIIKSYDISIFCAIVEQTFNKIKGE